MNTGKKRVYGGDEWYQVALNLCRGRYQRAIVRGDQRLSGSDLKGKAASYRGKYNASARTILERMTAAGVPFKIVMMNRIKVLFYTSGRV